MSKIHNMLHVSRLRNFVSDSSHVLEYDHLPIYEDLNYGEEAIRISDCKDQVLKRRTIPYSMVQ